MLQGLGLQISISLLDLASQSTWRRFAACCGGSFKAWLLTLGM